MAIIDDGIYAVRDGNMYKIIVPEPQFPGAKTVKIRLRPETNAERIRSMTDEELADWLAVYCNGQTAQEVGKPCVSDMGSCEECWLDWLKRESEGE